MRENTHKCAEPLRLYGKRGAGVNKYNIIDFIPIGRKNAIAMSELAKRIGISQREARKAIFNARCKGEIICSMCSENASGYYRPDDIAEVRPYITMQEHRIASAKAALKSAKKFVEAGGGNA